MSSDFDRETDEVEVEGIAENPVEVEVEAVADIPVEEVVAETSQRPQRNRVPPKRLHDYEVVGDDEVTPDGELVHFSLLASVEPINHNEALNIKQWKLAMVEELQAIERNNTWELVELPAHTKAIKVKWVFKLKHNADGSIARHKARLVARGFLQREGLDYSEVFAPVARLETVRLVVALA